MFRIEAAISDFAIAYAYKFPYYIQLVFPASVLLCVLVVLGGMNRKREVVSVQAMGYKRSRLLMPLLAVVGALSVPFYYLTTELVPVSLKKHYDIYDRKLYKRPSRFSKTKDRKIWFRKGDKLLYNVGFFDQQKKELIDLSLYYFDSEFKLKRLIKAPKAIWNNYSWVMKNGSILNSTKSSTNTQSFESLETFEVEKPQNLVRYNFNPETMTQSEVATTIARYKQMGINATPWVSVFHNRLSIVLVVFVFLLLAFPVSIRFNRGGFLVKDITVATVFCFAYWIFYNYLVSLGAEGRISPVFGAWAPTLVLLVYGLFKNFYADSRLQSS